ncbi:MarR family winged helix-turn-helix transcriptional regulator [Streptomyces sp. NRRL F-5123]|uniref:MarR family winged helix-turn-helix transcriptional regulator n=1 Tax=Streptomyces sp. NRRL F-5123 TaxID=1463856 RepID=UPI000B14199B|nr:MarR family transcriptional regulator [Streptomyces sp. NRRL F-5123]
MTSATTARRGADSPAEPLPGQGGEHGAERTAAERVWGNLRALVLEHNERRKEVAEALGMSFFRIKALRRIAKHPEQPYRMSELAAELACDRPYLTLVVDDLEERGLVRRTQHPEDRRAKIVSATPAGLATAARANAILGTPPPALLALPPDDLAALDRITAGLAAVPREG